MADKHFSPLLNFNISAIFLIPKTHAMFHGIIVKIRIIFCKNLEWALWRSSTPPWNPWKMWSNSTWWKNKFSIFGISIPKSCKSTKNLLKSFHEIKYCRPPDIDILELFWQFLSRFIFESVFSRGSVSSIISKNIFTV